MHSSMYLSQRVYVKIYGMVITEDNTANSNCRLDHVFQSCTVLTKFLLGNPTITEQHITYDSSSCFASQIYQADKTLGQK